jgi:dipeptidyl aminopeptidase/acylaminoacyl peptidase
MVPNEAHGHRGKETMEHMLYEELRWFDKYLKSSPSADQATGQ